MVLKEDDCGSVQKGEGGCGSETVTGQGGLAVGFLDGEEPDFTLLCTRPWPLEELCEMRFVSQHLQDNSTVS